ncbi:hypothetical protein AB205_0131940 [Aquarana catesbeiana]|uniref:Uncharacterized protein n=1 Tax=Aquarana catesbeiana TaxID=8400 RepID=A0A2G9SMA8_AQUCT|nr:hypothetical protein AB205_0131940 [Aquarana catesbeiana]
MSPQKLKYTLNGTCGFELQINKCLENAEYLYKKLKTLENFELVFPDEVAAKIKARMMEEGTAMMQQIKLLHEETVKISHIFQHCVLYFNVKTLSISIKK